MNRRMRLCTLVLLAGMCASASGIASAQTGPEPQASYKDEVRAGAEEIYMARTTRTQHKAGATPACAAAPFPSANEDYYDLWSFEVRARDGRIVDTHKNAIGGFTACFSQLVPGKPVQMYAVGTVAKIPWTGTGECVFVKSQPPVKTVVAFQCLLDLSGLPDAYTGGFGVSSTLQPFLKDQPPTAHVRGYVSTSVLTMRLWRKPAEENGK
jgi:hypothetical protein